MDWTVKSYVDANHHPDVVVNNDASGEPITVNAEPGVAFPLSARNGNDPDGDRLSYE